MTEEEKENNPSHETTGGFLRVKNYKDAWRDSWNKAEEDDRRKVYELPNWNNKIFKEITGIDVDLELGKVEMNNEEKEGNVIELNGKKYRLIQEQYYMTYDNQKQKDKYIHKSQSDVDNKAKVDSSKYNYRLDLTLFFEPVNRYYSESKLSTDIYITREQLETIIDILNLPVSKERI